MDSITLICDVHDVWRGGGGSCAKTREIRQPQHGHSATDPGQAHGDQHACRLPVDFAWILLLLFSPDRKSTYTRPAHHLIINANLLTNVDIMTANLDSKALCQAHAAEAFSSLVLRSSRIRCRSRTPRHSLESTSRYSDRVKTHYAELWLCPPAGALHASQRIYTGLQCTAATEPPVRHAESRAPRACAQAGRLWKHDESSSDYGEAYA
jgi:hypothetical protein